MALRDQPYLPLYVQDFLTDEKLIECSAQTTGVYIRLMCIMHKSDEYGKILLKQKDKQTTEQVQNFASKLAKQMPYSFQVILESLNELLEEKVLILDGDYLIQKRMVKDNDLSLKRALAGKKGGEFAQAKYKANTQANSENEYGNDNEITIEDKEGLREEKKEEKGEEPKTWRNDFPTYLSGLNETYNRLRNDKNFISIQERLHPNIDILLSLEKAYTNFWGKEAGWKHKKKQKSKEIDWESTLTNAIDMNKVWKPRNEQPAVQTTTPVINSRAYTNRG